jgi:hypothetical protein
MRLFATLLATVAVAVALPSYAAEKAPQTETAKPSDAAAAVDKSEEAKASATEYSVSRHRSIPFHG